MFSPTGCRESSPLSAEKDRRSRFTFRQLSQMASYAPGTPLRVIVHIDLDAFYAQCEMVRLGVAEDTPLAVQQWQGLIAVNYPARKHGVNRHCNITEAKKLYPDLLAQHVATWREGFATWAYRDDAAANIQTDKVSLDPYRLESRKILALVRETLPPQQKVEKASIDEVFVDLSAQVHGIAMSRFPELLHHSDPSERIPMPSVAAIDWGEDKLIALGDDEESRDPDWDDVVLNIASEIAREVRLAIRRELKYTCSAGIAHNKMLAKLGSGHNKPNQQTVIRSRASALFLEDLKFKKIRMLGGKLGEQVTAAFETDEVKELRRFSIEQLKARLGDETGTWLYNTIRGIDHSEVSSRTQIKSMLSAKSFRPYISSTEQAHQWLRIFAADIFARLVEEGILENKRRPKNIHLSFRPSSGKTLSRQVSIPAGRALEERVLFDLAKLLLVQILGEEKAWPCANLSLSVAGFEEGVVGNMDIGGFLVRGQEAQALRTERECGSKSALGLPRVDGASRKRRAEEHGIERFLARKLDDGPGPSNAPPNLPSLLGKDALETRQSQWDSHVARPEHDHKSNRGIDLFFPATAAIDDTDGTPSNHGNRGSRESVGFRRKTKTTHFETSSGDDGHSVDRPSSQPHPAARNDAVSSAGNSGSLQNFPHGGSRGGTGPRIANGEWLLMERADSMPPRMEGSQGKTFDEQEQDGCLTATDGRDFGQVRPDTEDDEARSDPHVCVECNKTFDDAEAFQSHSDWHLAWRLNEEEQERERGTQAFAGRDILGAVPRGGATGGGHGASPTSTSSGRRRGRGAKVEAGQTKLRFG